MDSNESSSLKTDQHIKKISVSVTDAGKDLMNIL